MSSPATEAKPGWIRRLIGSLLARPLWVAFGLFLTAAIVGGIAAWQAANPGQSVEEMEAAAMSQLQQEEFEEARRTAEVMARQKDLTPEQRGLVAYVLGLTLVRLECERERRPDRRAGLYLVAARYFEEAALQGVVPELQGEVDYWNGRSLVLAQQAPLARGALENALESNPQRQREILTWLSEAYLADRQVEKKRGIQHLDRLLTDPTLDARERQRLLAIKVRLLLADRQIEPALSVLTELLPDAPDRLEVQLALAQYYLEEAERLRKSRERDAEAQAAYQKAEEALLQRGDRTLMDADQDRGRSLYLLGQAQRGLGKTDEAVKNFAYVRRQYFDQPIGIAAGFGEAQAILQADDLKGAYQLFSSLLRETARPANQGESQWLNQEMITRELEWAVEQYLNVGDCVTAEKLAQEFRAVSLARTPQIPLGYSARLRANALQKWVQLLEQRLREVPYTEQEAVRQQLLEKYRDYAHALYSLAVNRYATENYATDLFQAGEYFYQARDYHRAILTLQQYLDADETQFAAQARLRIGQSHLAKREYEKAVATLANCWILFPNDPVVYQARYQAAESYLELGDAKKAEEMLRANLESDKLTPSSQEWIESLFLLGALQFDEGKKLEAQSYLATNAGNVNNQEDPVALMESAARYFEQSINRLSEAVQRAPESEAALNGYYRLAEAYRRYNRWHEIQMSMTTISARRAQLNTRIRQYDEKSVELLTRLEERLLELREARPLDEIQDRLLRNSYFARGNLYYRLNQFEQAIQMYRTVSNMVIQEPEVLEAYVQIAGCYRRLNRNDEAVRVVNQAKIILRDRIPATADFEATTRFPRDRWVTMLDWLTTI